MRTYKQTAASTIGWPTRRLRDWAVANGVTSLATFNTWLNGQITNTWDATQATNLKNIITELTRAMVEIANDGET
jgi:hypothetical protein